MQIKRSHGIVIVLAFLLTGFSLLEGCNFNHGSSTSSEPTASKGFLYSFDETLEAYSITGYIGTDTEIVIPSTHLSKTVSGIAINAFIDQTQITNVYIPNSLIYIGSRSFSGCTSLNSVTFENQSEINRIDSFAFFGCQQLSSVDFGINSRLEKMGDYLFSGCSNLTSVIIPKTVLSIGSSAFVGCNSLLSLSVPFIGGESTGDTAPYIGYFFGAPAREENDAYVPASLENVSITGGTEIAFEAFLGCSHLQSIDISAASINRIGFRALANCSSLEALTIPFVGTIPVSTEHTHFGYIFGAETTSENDVFVPVSLKTVSVKNALTIPDGAFDDCTHIASLTLGSALRSIGANAFSNCTSLIAVSIENGLISIGYEAFLGCDVLKSIVIPDTVTTIAFRAFYGCLSLAKITIPYVGFELNGSSRTYFGHIFGAVSQDENVLCVPASLKEVTITGNSPISDGAFANCINITSIVITGNIETIGSGTFYGCISLTTIALPSTLNNIADLTFSGCAALESIVIPDNTNTIGFEAFAGVSNLLSLSVPNHVTEIGFRAFANCSKLTAIYLPFIGMSSAVNDHDNLGYIFGAVTRDNNQDFVPASLKTVIITGGSTIGNGAFLNCANITSIVLPTTLTEISTSAFYNCRDLTAIIIPSSVTSIQESAFHGCENLTIYCVARKKPVGWNVAWNDENRPVVWGYSK